MAGVFHPTMASTLLTILAVVGTFVVLLNVIMVYAAFATLGSDEHRPPGLASTSGE